MVRTPEEEEKYNKFLKWKYENQIEFYYFADHYSWFWSRPGWPIGMPFETSDEMKCYLIEMMEREIEHRKGGA